MGENQWGKKKYPPDDELIAAFIQYGKEKNGSGLNAEEQLARLEKEFGLRIGKRTLTTLRKRLLIPSVRKNPVAAQDRMQAVLDVKQHDIAGRWGVAQVRQRLANQGIIISRDETRDILHDHFDEEFETRFVGKKDALKRTPLDCLGPWHQIHCDGHEKLGAQALNMGGIALGIYAFKDQFGTFVPIMRVLPNVRKANTIAHFYLDFIEEYGCICLTLITDKGSEVGVKDGMIYIQKTLRLESAPEFTIEEWPPWVGVQSKKNTPIEGFWRWKRAGEGHSIRQAILVGKNEGIFNPANPRHIDIFNWLWPRLVQERLDEFREYWNNHKLSKQQKKILPSGTSPRHMWLVPSSVRATARDCSVRVNMESVRRLRDEMGGHEGREEAMQFVSREFSAEADSALGQLGYPTITLSTAWDVFVAVDDILSHV
ncbi:hypothetical protein HWV62_8132 [Athelia sp. TMB]|nr:hypothetical protein HWV62_8132 [Athelia sp. TMB]